ncbi:MAG: HD domain-containing phosphohydrolase [Actinomycetota bacterium]
MEPTLRRTRSPHAAQHAPARGARAPDGRDLTVIRMLASAVEARDHHTGDHANHVSSLSHDLWRWISRREPEHDLIYGFLLHDVGKIAIPDAILLKCGPLTPAERAIMRNHVGIGLRLVEPLGFSKAALDVIRFHHERWDGAGYPNGLSGNEIPAQARAFSIVDAYDAMTSDRPYRRGLPPATALAEIEQSGGTQFDPEFVMHFAALADRLGLVA